MLTAKNEEELQVIFDELFRQTDRGAAIIAGSILEELLTNAIKRRLILTTKLSVSLFSFERNGAIANFAPKIDVAYAIGLIKPDLRDDLHNIRRIRNRFAHSIDPIDFKDTKVIGLCSAIRSASRELKIPKHRFLSAVGWIASVLTLLANLRTELKYFREQDGMEAELEEALSRFLPDSLGA